MVKRKRNYKTEYRRRIKLGKLKGLSKAQARGHRRAVELAPSRQRAERSLEDAKLQLGLRFLRKTRNFTRAAKEAHISPERLRRYALEKGIIGKSGRRWSIKKDLARRVPIYSGGSEHTITVDKFEAASLVGKYMSAVRQFLLTQDLSHLQPFEGKSVVDVGGKRYPLETRPTVLYRLSHSGGPSFEQIYRIVI